MKIKLDNIQLAGPALATGALGVVAEPCDLEVEWETTTQEAKPIGAAARKLYNRKNAGGRLSFSVRPAYASLAAAKAAAWEIAGYKGTAGTLDIWPASSTSDDDKTSISGAIMRRVKTRQIGVAVEAEYEIVF